MLQDETHIEAKLRVFTPEGCVQSLPQVAIRLHEVDVPSPLYFCRSAPAFDTFWILFRKHPLVTVDRRRARQGVLQLSALLELHVKFSGPMSAVPAQYEWPLPTMRGFG